MDWSQRKQLGGLQQYYNVWADRGMPPPQENFANVGLRFSPARGAALLWPDVDTDNVFKQHPLTTHAAEVIERAGVQKWAANAWIHMRDFRTPYAKGLTG